MKKFLLGKAENAVRDSYIWNLAASVINAAESVLVLMLATRFTDMAEAGMLTIAFTVANLMMNLGKYGVRNYQVTDIAERCSFSDYRALRQFTVLLMAAAVAVYLLFCAAVKQYSLRKTAIVLVVFLIYAAEVWEDVYWGAYQKQERLDIGARMFSLRWTLTLAVWCGGMVLFHDSLVGGLAALVVDWLCLWYSVSATKEIVMDQRPAKRENVLYLFRQCLPLCLSGFFYYYITNASKYAIDGVLPDEVQACYGFVAMPIFVICLLNSILYQPILVSMAQEWSMGEKKKVIRRIRKQLLLIAGITVICMLGAFFLGIPVLSWLYAVDLTAYKAELLILLLGSAWLAAAGFMHTVLVIMRRQIAALWGYAAVAAVALAATSLAVSAYGTDGAAVANMIWPLLLAVIFTVMVIKEIQTERE